jgi:hypothetical protein
MAAKEGHNGYLDVLVELGRWARAAVGAILIAFSDAVRQLQTDLSLRAFGWCCCSASP